MRGADAESYLQGQLSQDVDALAVGASADSLLLQPDGKLSALLRVTRVDGQGFVLDIDAGFGDAVVARLRKFLLRSKVEIEPPGLALPGPAGAGVTDAAAGLLDRAGRSGVPGPALRMERLDAAWTCSGPRTSCSTRRPARCPMASPLAAPRRSRPAASSRASRPWAAELTDKTIAAEAGLVERTVSFTKGCYTGQELVARLDSRGSNVARRLVGVVAPVEPRTAPLPVA